MRNADSPEQLCPIDATEQRIFVDAVRVLLPKNDAVAGEWGQDPNLQTIRLPGREQRYRLGRTILTAAEYPAYGDGIHHVQVNTEGPSPSALLDNTSLYLSKVYYVEPSYGHSAYFETEHLAGAFAGGSAMNRTDIHNSARGSVEAIINTYSMQAQLGLTIFTPQRLRDILALMRQCKPDNLI